MLRGSATVESSILADTVAGADDCRGTLAGSANLIETPGTCTVPAGSLAGDPALAVLADNGGPTPTMLPQAGSPALSAGANPDGARFDQRGARSCASPARRPTSAPSRRSPWGCR